MQEMGIKLPAFHAGRPRSPRKSNNDLVHNEVQQVQEDIVATSFQDLPNHFSVVIRLSSYSKRFTLPTKCLSQVVDAFQKWRLTITLKLMVITPDISIAPQNEISPSP